MPHIQLKLVSGRSEEIKRKLADEFTKVIMETLGNTEESVSVAIEDIPKEEWKVAVYDKEIKPSLESLYKKPGYSFEQEKD